MSRFYRALKEASRLRPPAEGSETKVDWSSMLAPSTEEIPLVPNPPAASASEPPLLLLPELDELDGKLQIDDSAPSPLNLVHQELMDQVMGVAAPGAPPADQVFGTHTEIVIDQGARLIPHAIDPVVVEHYRRLRTKILQQHKAKPFRTLVVASPGPQEGKTVTVINLGLSFAMMPGFRVLIIDGDLRRGSLGKWLGIGGQPGLSNLLDGSSEMEDVVLKCDETPLCFMVRGTSKLPPAELLQSPNAKGHFRRIAEHFDLVLVDSAPVNLVTDVQLLAANCEAVLLIARAFRTKRKALQQAVKDLSSFRVIGTVLNGGTRAELYRRYHGYY